MRGPEPVLIETEEPEESSRSDPVRTLVLPLWRARVLIGATLIIGGGGGLFMGLMQPNTFRSVGKLNLRAGAREETTAESLIDASRGVGGQPRDYITTELTLLRNPLVFERVARKISPPVLFRSYDPTALDDENTPEHLRLFHKAQAWWFTRGASKTEEATGHQLDDCATCVRLAADSLARTVSIYSEGPIIVVSYAAIDPYLAQEVVETFLETAVERHQEYYNTAERLEVVTEKLDAARTEKNEAARAFQEYKETCGFIDLDRELAARLAERDQLRTRIIDENHRVQELAAHREVLQARFKAEDPEIPSLVEFEPQPNTKLQTYLANEIELEGKLIEIEQRRGLTDEERERERHGLQTQLDWLRARIEAEPPYIERDPKEVMIDNPDRKDYRNQLDALDLELTGLETSIPLAESNLKAVEKRILEANRCGTDYRAAQAEVERTRSAYEALERNWARAVDMDSLKDSNLQIIQDAEVPRYKEGPRRAKLLIVGLILGWLAGAALGFVRHLMDKTVRSPHDVERLLGMRVVGVLPRRSLPRSLRRAMRRAAL